MRGPCNWKWKITAADSMPRRREAASDWWPCANGPASWAARSPLSGRRKGAPWFGSRCQRSESGKMKPKISVLLVDDHNLVRRGFRKILEDDAEIVIAGEAEDGATAVRMAGSL